MPYVSSLTGSSYTGRGIDALKPHLKKKRLEREQAQKKALKPHLKIEMPYMPYVSKITGRSHTGRGISSQPSGYTSLSNIQKSDVLPQYQEAMGFADQITAEQITRKPEMLDKLKNTYNQIIENTIGATGQASIEGPKIPLSMLLLGGTTQSFLAPANAQNIGQRSATTISYSTSYSPTPNTSTINKLSTWASKFTKSMTKPALAAGLITTLIGGAIFSYPWAKHLEADNVVGTYMIAARDLKEQGFVNESDNIRNTLNEVLNKTFVESVISNIPYVNVIDSAKKTIDSAIITNKAYQKALEDLYPAETSTDTSTTKVYPAETSTDTSTTKDYWEKVREEQAEQERAMIDYFNQQRIMTEQNILEMKKSNQKELSDFWIAHQKELSRLEREERERTAEFWLAYQKAILHLQEANRPSALNFGLL